MVLQHDRNRDSGYYDFATVAIHEIGHVLGFTGNFQSTGKWALNGYKTI